MAGLELSSPTSLMSPPPTSVVVVVVVIAASVSLSRSRICGDVGDDGDEGALTKIDQLNELDQFEVSMGISVGHESRHLIIGYPRSWIVTFLNLPGR